jgi:predicted PurR-regulated permease PerM
MGQQLKIHPWGGEICGAGWRSTRGVVGIYLAVPVTAAFPVIWRMSVREEPKRGSCAQASPLDESVASA